MPPIEHVWVADDDRSIRWVLERTLQKAGIETRCFESADQVIVALRSEQPDALVTDIRMPGTDGLIAVGADAARIPHRPGHYYDCAFRPRKCGVGLSGRGI